MQPSDLTPGIDRINRELAPLVRPLSGLHPDPKNVKKHGRRSVDEIARSLQLYGQQKPIVVDAGGVAIAGSGTIEAARHLGWTQLAAVTWDGGRPRARGYAVSDNRTAEFAEWDDTNLAAVLAEIASEGLHGDDLGFTARELADLLGGTAAGGAGADDDHPDPPANPITKHGDVWLLGEHRIVCGDSTLPDTVALALAGRVAQLGFTDPPWNVAYDGGAKANGVSKTRRQSDIANDDLGVAFPEFARRFSATFATAIQPGGLVYVVMSAQEWPVIDVALRGAGFHWSSSLIWLKDRAVLGRKDYQDIYEPIWYGWREGAPRLHPLEDRTQTSVWPIKRPSRSDDHPTTKPLELIDRAVRNSSRRGELVLDLFLGSGSTLIAADAAGRLACGVELSPGYCDVIVQRWEKATGGKAVRE